MKLGTVKADGPRLQALYLARQFEHVQEHAAQSFKKPATESRVARSIRLLDAFDTETRKTILGEPVVPRDW